MTDNPSFPTHQFNIRAFLDLPWNLTLDSQVFWVCGIDNLWYFDGGVPEKLEDFWRWDVRLAWTPLPDLELALVGQNLASEMHAEYGDQFQHFATLVPMSVYGKVTWRWGSTTR